MGAAGTAAAVLEVHLFEGFGEGGEEESGALFAGHDEAERGGVGEE